MTSPIKFNIIAAVGKDGSIGKGGDLIWHIPEDLKYFKSLTSGHPVIMGRKTWESLPKRPLPGRLNVVLTRNDSYQAEGALTVRSLDEALEACTSDPLWRNEVPFVIGGAEIYREALAYADRVYLTAVDAECCDADAWFPVLADTDWTLDAGYQPETGSGKVGFRFLRYIRKE